MAGKEKVVSEQKHTAPGVGLCGEVFHLQARISQCSAALYLGRVEDEVAGFKLPWARQLKYFYFRVCHLCVSVCRGQKRALDPLELELQAIVVKCLLPNKPLL